MGRTSIDLKRRLLPAGSGIFALVLLLLFACSVFGPGCSKKEESSPTEYGPYVGAIAPNFSLASLDGETVELHSLRGNVVILDFWATWCPPCRITLPLLQRVYDRTRGRRVEIYAISTDRAPEERVRRFAEKMGLSVPILLDRRGLVSRAYRIRAIPSLFIIDQTGKICDKHVGADRSMDKILLNKVSELLGK